MSEKQRALLIVEDDPALQKQKRWAFDTRETIVADDRESAIAQLRRHEPAVVTMDLVLPPAPDDVTEGFQLLREILALAPDTKVIVLTGAMQPARFKSSDAEFNIGAAATAVQLLSPGVYIVMNGRVLDPDRVKKNRRLHRFEEA